MTLKEISPYEWAANPIREIRETWMLVAAGLPDGQVNAMTASWGGVGHIWQQPVAFVFIRPQRRTKLFVEGAAGLSLSFLDSQYRDALQLLGSVSGFDDPNKIERSGLTVARRELVVEQTPPPAEEAVEQVPYFAQAHTVLVCERLYQQQMLPECFVDKAQLEQWYGDWHPGVFDDLHTLYIAKLRQVLVAG